MTDHADSPGGPGGPPGGILGGGREDLGPRGAPGGVLGGFWGGSWGTPWGAPKWPKMALFGGPGPPPGGTGPPPKLHFTTRKVYI